MADEIALRLNGADQLMAALSQVTGALRKRVLRNALAAGAREIQRAAQAAAPMLRFPSRRRSVGTIRKNITVRTSKFARQAGDVGVFVGVRPLSGSRQKKLGKRGASNPNDPYYWLFQEFGWTPRGPRKHFLGGVLRTRRSSAGHRIPGRKFITVAAQNRGEAAIATFMKTVVTQIEKLNQKGALNVG